MRSRLPRISPFSLATLLGVFLCCALARPAHAQLGTGGTIGTTTASLADGDIFIGVQATVNVNLSQFDLARFFNKANCDCSTDVFLYYTLTQTGFAKRNAVPQGIVYFFLGAGCNDIVVQKTNCQFIGSDQIATFMANGRETIQTTARAVSANTSVATTSLDGGSFTDGTKPNPDCTSPINGSDQTIWAIFDYGGDGTYDFSATQAVHVDLTPPPAPTNVLVRPGNEALTVTWTQIDFATNMDQQGYQVYCQRGDGLQVFPDNTFSSAVRTCPKTAGTGLTGLSPFFACSPLLNRTADSFRVKILENDIWYAAAVVAIDNSGNALEPVLVGRINNDPNSANPVSSFQQPQKTNSFYDVYRDGNITNSTPGQRDTPGAATGGFCAVAGAPGDWAVGFGAGASVLALAVALARRRRR